MMKKKTLKDGSFGGLFLLFFLLLIHALSNVFCSGADLLTCVGGEAPHVLPAEMTAFQKMTLGIPVSINREGREGLTAVPGIGPGLARLITNERDHRGGFKRLDEIKFIRGIGPRLYEKIIPHLVL